MLVEDWKGIGILLLFNGVPFGVFCVSFEKLSWELLCKVFELRLLDILTRSKSEWGALVWFSCASVVS